VKTYNNLDRDATLKEMLKPNTDLLESLYEKIRRDKGKKVDSEIKTLLTTEYLDGDF
jgi:hypothetical protein